MHHFVALNNQLYICHLDSTGMNSMLRMQIQKEPKAMFDLNMHLLEKRSTLCTQQNVQTFAHSSAQLTPFILSSRGHRREDTWPVKREEQNRAFLI